ncbi:glutamate-rich protein 1 isoform X1 [Anguilla rostrata]|uniref:glutamate-rich protein 1 isoform X1 n=2 Tax=Anguilla rostrata TaxID=7938 RepID=UPI0030D523AE
MSRHMQHNCNMANRKEVFQEKLMRRLYPVPPKTEKPQAPLTSPGSVCEKACAKVKTIRGTVAAGEEGKSKPPLTRVYTVLPPPEGYGAGDGESAALPEPGSVDTEDGPAAEARDERSPEPSERGHQRRRRKRRRHGAAGGGGGGGGGGGAEEASEPGGAREEEAGTAGGDAKTSRNRRRKEKKRRRKERLTSLGLAPGAAAAVEFTYQPGPVGEEEEEEQQERGEEKMAELLDFLRATREICLSDRGASAAAQVPDAVMEGLTAGLAAGTAPPADRAGLRRLLALALRRDAGGLAGALEEFGRGSDMPPAETSAVRSLFRYWLTDVLPARSDPEPAGSPAPPPATHQEPVL